jgi:3-oxoacyl-[acyl-carrier protein] reductase
MQARSVLVSGGGTGIGRAVAAAFAARGDEVTILGRRADVLRTTAKEIHGRPPVRTVAVDLTDPAAVEEAVGLLPERVDVLVNNAGRRGSAPDGEGLRAVADRWRRDLNDIVLPAVLLTEAVEPRLARPGGRVVTISSIAALRGNGAYGAGKAALHAWNLDLAQRLGKDGVTANVVVPGYVTGTEFFGTSPDAAELERRTEQTLVKRVGRPEDIAAAVVFLASPEAGCISAEFLNCSGGTVLGR